MNTFIIISAVIVGITILAMLPSLSRRQHIATEDTREDNMAGATRSFFFRPIYFSFSMWSNAMSAPPANPDSLRTLPPRMVRCSLSSGPRS